VNVDYPYLSGAAIMLAGFVISLIWVSQGGKKGDVESRTALEAQETA
jgi:hypothetical protein